MTYEADFSEVRSYNRGPKRYLLLRAVANGPDSYNSLFTKNARDSIIRQIKGSSVKTKMLHKDAVMDNVRSFIESKVSNPTDKSVAEKLLAQLPMADFPFATCTDARFVDDNELEVEAEVNDELAVIPEEKAKMDAYYSLVENKKVTGASLVFSNVKSFASNGKTYIDDLYVQGLDIVDRPAHYKTRVVETFMRAASDAVPIGESMTEDVFKKVDEVANVVKKIDQKLVADEQAKADAEKAKAAELLAQKEKAMITENEELKRKLAETESQLKEIEPVLAEATRYIKDLSAKRPVVFDKTTQVPSQAPKESLRDLFKQKYEGN